MDTKKDLEQLDAIVNQNYDTDYLKDVIGTIDMKVDLCKRRVDELDHIIYRLVKEILKKYPDIKLC